MHNLAKNVDAKNDADFSSNLDTPMGTPQGIKMWIFLQTLNLDITFSKFYDIDLREIGFPSKKELQATLTL